MNLKLERNQVLLGAPALLGVLIAAAFGGLVVLPGWQQLQADEQELSRLEEQRDSLPMLRRQLDSLLRQQEQVDQILDLIAGSGELKTFLAQLSEQAAQTGVLLDGYEPVEAVAPSTQRESKNKNKNKAMATPPDPLLAPGMRKTSVLLTARGSGPQLLDFLRRLESLSLLVVQSDLSLKSGKTSKDKDGLERVEPTELRLSLGLYARDHSPSQKPGNRG